MFKKVTCLVLFALIADVYSGTLVAPSAAIISSKSELAEDVETDSNPSYSFSYSVNDDTTGDHKSQFETREGDSVVGRYTLLEPTGETRQVDYTADAVNGFNAVVTRHPTAKIIAAPAKIIAQPAIFAPTKYFAQPAIAAPAKIIAQPAIVAPAPAKIVAAPVATKLIATSPYVAAAPAKFISSPIVAAQPFGRYAYAAPYSAYSAPLVAQYHAPAAAYISHSPLTYHAPAAAIIHH